MDAISQPSRSGTGVFLRGLGVAALVSLAWLVPGTPSLGSPDALHIPDYGVGTAVVERQLKGQADSFTEGTRVFFWTRVRGGEAGDRIRHVWLREGVEVVSIGLNVGGSHWRTHSSKLLGPGTSGNWVVEARDANNRVLARLAFTCTD